MSRPRPHQIRCGTTTKEPVEAGSRDLEALRSHMRIPLHHALCLPASKSLQFVRRRPSLAVPRSKRVPQVVPAEVLDPGSL